MKTLSIVALVASVVILGGVSLYYLGPVIARGLNGTNGIVETEAPRPNA